MLIKKITIENFQSYYGEQSIAFSKGLNLVVGNGGKGKSKLFNAFYWVLFGKIYITDEGWSDTDGLPQSSHGAMHKYEFINKRALYEKREGGNVFTAVSLELEDDKGNLYTIVRSVTTSRTNTKEWDNEDAWHVQNNILKVDYENATGSVTKIGYQAEDIVRCLFPEEIRNYIWFQGESLESLINFRDPKTLKNAVSHISYYPYYEKLCSIIDKSYLKIERLERTRITSQNKQNNEVLALTSRMERLSVLIGEEDRKKKKLEHDIEVVKQGIADDDTKLQGLASYTQLVSDYNKVQQELRNIEAAINRNMDWLRTELPSRWILRGIGPMVEKADQLLHNYVQETFSTPTQKFIEDPGRKKLLEILHDGVCFVCGSKVEEGSEAHAHITNRLAEQEAFYKAQEEYLNNLEAAQKFTLMVGRIQDRPEKLKHYLQGIDSVYLEIDENLEAFYAKRARKKAEKEELDQEIEKIRKRYGVDPVTQANTASNITSSLNSSRTTLEQLERDLRICNNSIAQYTREKAEKAAKLEEMGVIGVDNKTIPETQWKNISYFLSDVCSRVKEDARLELLHKIQDRANQFYKKFTEHDNGYQGTVKINDDYSIEYDAGLNTSHNDRRKMSIINALLSLNQEAMGIYYPFISDAPTSSFDKETTHKYLLGVKDIFGQCIIMTKDVDIDDPMYKDLISQPNVSRVYLLESEKTCEEGKTPERHEVSTIVTFKN